MDKLEEAMRLAREFVGELARDGGLELYDPGSVDVGADYAVWEVRTPQRFRPVARVAFMVHVEELQVPLLQLTECLRQRWRMAMIKLWNQVEENHGVPRS